MKTKTKHLLITGILLICILRIASAQITFQKNLGASSGNSVQQTTDGGYIIAGGGYLIKTDVYGDTLWTKKFIPVGTIFPNLFSFAQQTSDGGYIVTGKSQTVSNGDVYLAKTDANGYLLWTKTFGGASEDIGNCVRQTSDGGYIIAGSTLSYGSGTNSKALIIKTDANGDSLWTRAFGGSFDELAFSIQQTTDGGYIITGNTTSFGNNNDAYLIRTDGSGNLLWSKAFGDGNFFGSTDGYSVQQTTDGGFIITGTTVITGTANLQVYLVKTDTNGDTLWQKTYGGPNVDNGYSVQQTTDGGYIIAGRASYGSNFDFEAYLIKTNATGDTLWTRTFGGIYNDWAYSVQQTADGGYIITGISTTLIGWEIFLIKTDANGNTGCNQGNIATIVTSPTSLVSSSATAIYLPSVIVSIPMDSVHSGSIVTILCASVGINKIISDNSFIVSPNPFANELLISGSAIGGKEVILYDVTGKKILRKKTTDGETRLNTSLLLPGFYLLYIASEKESRVFKVIRN